MYSTFEIALLSAILMASAANAAVVETCATQQDDQVGVLTTGTALSDLSKLQLLESDTTQQRLASFWLCTNANAQLTGTRVRVASVPVDGSAAGAPALMENYGNVSGSGITCAPLVLDYANGEYISEITTWYDANYTRKMSVTTSLGNELVKGKQSTTMETATLSFEEDAQPVALHGNQNSNFFSSMGAITVDPSCQVGSEIPEPQQEEAAAAAFPLGAIIGIAVGVVVVLGVVGGIIGFVVYKKKTHEREKTGVETVTLTKTRPMTPPPVDTAKAGKGDAVPHVATDEEDISAGHEEQQSKQAQTQLSVEDLTKKQSMVNKPDQSI